MEGPLTTRAAAAALVSLLSLPAFAVGAAAEDTGVGGIHLYGGVQGFSLMRELLPGNLEAPPFTVTEKSEFGLGLGLTYLMQAGLPELGIGLDGNVLSAGGLNPKLLLAVVSAGPLLAYYPIPQVGFYAGGGPVALVSTTGSMPLTLGLKTGFRLRLGTVGMHLGVVGLPVTSVMFPPDNSHVSSVSFGGVSYDVGMGLHL